MPGGASYGFIPLNLMGDFFWQCQQQQEKYNIVSEIIPKLKTSAS